MLKQQYRKVLSSAGTHRLSWKFIKFICQTTGLNLQHKLWEEQGILHHDPNRDEAESYFLNNILLKSLKDIDKPIFFDVGANVGNFSRQLLELFPQGQIHAFEPNPVTFAELVRQHGDLVKSNNCGIGSSVGVLELWIRAENKSSSHASLYKEVLTDQHHYHDANPIIVDVTTIDQYCDTHNISRIDFLKIDTEGHEIEALRGASRMLQDSRIRMVQFEFNEMNIVSKTFLKNFIDTLSGYSFYRLTKKGYKKIRYRSHEEVFLFQNIVASSVELPAV